MSQIDRRVRPCVTFNKENTHDWFRKRENPENHAVIFAEIRCLDC